MLLGQAQAHRLGVLGAERAVGLVDDLDLPAVDAAVLVEGVDHRLEGELLVAVAAGRQALLDEAVEVKVRVPDRDRVGRDAAGARGLV